MKPDMKQKKKALDKKTSRVADLKSNADNYRSKGALEQEVINLEKIIHKLKKIIDYWSDILGYHPDEGPEEMFKRATEKRWLKSKLEASNEDHKEALFRLVIASINLENYTKSIYRRIRFYKDYKEAKKEFEIAEAHSRLLIMSNSPKGIKDNGKKEIKQETK